MDSILIRSLNPVERSVLRSQVSGARALAVLLTSCVILRELLPNFSHLGLFLCGTEENISSHLTELRDSFHSSQMVCGLPVGHR